ncbi:MAG TPA: arginine--tRNA ligase [Candidatus Paceibacterota bacterium]|nr:arginine--tRNA ligase [Candidatus Paceibacterota bacterium]
MEETLRKAIHDALVAEGAGDTVFALEWPADLAHGDFATNAALASAKALGRAPRDVAEALAPRIRESLGELVETVSVAGPGFVNLTLAKPAVTGALAEALRKPEVWGAGTLRAGERVAFEYSCPNPFKEMHVGHLMSTVIGEATSRLIENQGARVLRDTYGGDVGPHVAKALWALRRKGIAEPETAEEIGDAYAQGSRAYEESEEAKAAIDALNATLYQTLAKEAADRTEEERMLYELWRHGRDISLAAHKAVWDALDTSFDYVLHESETTPVGLSEVLAGLERGVFRMSEGAVIYDGEAKGLHTLVFVTSRGTPTYEAKDVGLAFLKEARLGPLDHSYITTAAEQSGHFAVFLAALEELAPELARKTMHVPHGFLRLTEGKMSSREGNVITAVTLIEDLVAKAQEKNDDPLIARAVAIAAIKYMILRQSAGSDIIFDPEKSLSLDGDSGPYLQYALVRAKSVLAQPGSPESLSVSPRSLDDLERLLIRFPEVARRAEALRAPHAVAQYLTQLAGEWNSFYAANRIMGNPDEAHLRAVARAFAITMERGLSLLAIPVPERM